MPGGGHSPLYTVAPSILLTTLWGKYRCYRLHVPVRKQRQKSTLAGIQQRGIQTPAVWAPSPRLWATVSCCLWLRKDQSLMCLGRKESRKWSPLAIVGRSGRHLATGAVLLRPSSQHFFESQGLLGLLLKPWPHPGFICSCLGGPTKRKSQESCCW